MIIIYTVIRDFAVIKIYICRQIGVIDIDPGINDSNYDRLCNVGLVPLRSASIWSTSIKF